MKFYLHILFFILIVVLTVTCKQEDVNNSIHKTYYEGTDKIMQSVEYKNGKKNGHFIEYYKNGKILSDQIYVNDLLNDSTVEFHENGVKATLKNYNTGTKVGKWRKYNKEGLMYSDVTYSNGFLDGVSNKFTYITGKPLEKLFYKNGMQEGKQEYYYNNGRPKYFYSAKNGNFSDLEEWTEPGKKINLDFKISITEKNQLLLNNSVILMVTLENPKPTDEVFQQMEFSKGIYTTPSELVRRGNHYEYVWMIRRGSMVMEKLIIVARRKTDLGNIFEKKVNYNFSATNY